MSGARIDTKPWKLYLDGNPVDAVNYPSLGLIELSSETLPNRSEYLKRVISIHEPIGLISERTGIKDLGELISYEIVKRYLAVKSKPAIVAGAVKRTHFEDWKQNCYFFVRYMTNPSGDLGQPQVSKS